MAALDATLLQAVTVKAQAINADTQIKKALIAHAEAAKVVLANQTMNFSVLEDKDKDYIARVQWLDLCGGAVQDCTPKCTITGSGIDSQVLDYNLDLCKETTATSIGAEVFRTNELNMIEVMAMKVVEHKRKLDEWVAQQVILKLKAFSGQNFYPNGYTYANNTTYIPDADWGVKLATYMQLVAMYNEMPSAYKLSNEQFFYPYNNALFDNANNTGAGDGLRAQLLGQDLYFDIFNFNKAGVTEDIFVVEPGAVAIANKSRFTTTPFYEDGTDRPQWRWTEISDNLPGFEYEFYLQKSCRTVTGKPTQEEIVTNMAAKVRLGIFNNPLGCNVTLNGQTGKTTGVISLSKGNAPA